MCHAYIKMTWQPSDDVEDLQKETNQLLYQKKTKYPKFGEYKPVKNTFRSKGKWHTVIGKGK